MDPLSRVGVAIATFVATNIDDLFLVTAYFADPTLRRTAIVGGQFLGIGFLVVASGVAALGALLVPEGWTALLGIVPLGLGLHRLTGRSQNADLPDGPIATPAHSELLAIAAVTIANGGDNLGVYIPLFASDPRGIPLCAGVFAVMTALWCWLAHGLVHHRALGEPIRRYGHRILPFVLIGLGLYILSGLPALDA